MALVQALMDNRLLPSRVLQDSLATCTGCLACEAACPSGVKVTRIIQAARECMGGAAGRGMIPVVIAAVLKNPFLFKASAWLAPALLHYTRDPKAHRAGRRESGKGRWIGNNRGRVVFFPGCAIEHFQPDIGRAATAVLSTLGYEVIIPERWWCCGRPLLSLGERTAAADLAARNAALFASYDAVALITACASCGLTFKKEYPELLGPGVQPPVVLDIHEFLAGQIEPAMFNAVRKRMTIHDPCHLGRGQGLSHRVRELLQSVPGMEIAEMDRPDQCCGFGGVMRMTHRGLSDGIADRKAADILKTEASIVVTGCPGCCMQIASVLRRKGSPAAVVHTVQILADALKTRKRLT